MATGARTGGEPSGGHWDHRAEARDTAGGPGRYTNTGHGEFVGVDKQKGWRSYRADCQATLMTKCCPLPCQDQFDDSCHAESNAAHNFLILHLLDVTPLSMG